MLGGGYFKDMEIVQHGEGYVGVDDYELFETESPEKNSNSPSSMKKLISSSSNNNKEQKASRMMAHMSIQSLRNSIDGFDGCLYKGLTISGSSVQATQSNTPRFIQKDLFDHASDSAQQLFSQQPHLQIGMQLRKDDFNNMSSESFCLKTSKLESEKSPSNCTVYNDHYFGMQDPSTPLLLLQKQQQQQLQQQQLIPKLAEQMTYAQAVAANNELLEHLLLSNHTNERVNSYHLNNRKKKKPKTTTSTATASAMGFPISQKNYQTTSTTEEFSNFSGIGQQQHLHHFTSLSQQQQLQARNLKSAYLSKGSTSSRRQFPRSYKNSSQNSKISLTEPSQDESDDDLSKRGGFMFSEVNTAAAAAADQQERQRSYRLNNTFLSNQAIQKPKLSDTFGPSSNNNNNNIHQSTQSNNNRNAFLSRPAWDQATTTTGNLLNTQKRVFSHEPIRMHLHDDSDVHIGETSHQSHNNSNNNKRIRQFTNHKRLNSAYILGSASSQQQSSDVSSEHSNQSRTFYKKKPSSQKNGGDPVDLSFVQVINPEMYSNNSGKKESQQLQQQFSSQSTNSIGSKRFSRFEEQSSSNAQLSSKSHIQQGSVSPASGISASSKSNNYLQQQAQLLQQKGIRWRSQSQQQQQQQQHMKVAVPEMIQYSTTSENVMTPHSVGQFDVHSEIAQLPQQQQQQQLQQIQQKSTSINNSIQQSEVATAAGGGQVLRLDSIPFNQYSRPNSRTEGKRDILRTQSAGSSHAFKQQVVHSPFKQQQQQQHQQIVVGVQSNIELTPPSVAAALSMDRTTRFVRKSTFDSQVTIKRPIFEQLQLKKQSLHSAESNDLSIRGTNSTAVATTTTQQSNQLMSRPTSKGQTKINMITTSNVKGALGFGTQKHLAPQQKKTAFTTRQLSLLSSDLCLSNAAAVAGAPLPKDSKQSHQTSLQIF